MVDDADVAPRAEWWASKVTRMPADGLAIAKAGFTLVEQTAGLRSARRRPARSCTRTRTNLRFEEDEFNFVKERGEARHQQAFKVRDEHFEVPEP